MLRFGRGGASSCLTLRSGSSQGGWILLLLMLLLLLGLVIFVAMVIGSIRSYAGSVAQHRLFCSIILDNKREK